MKWRLLTYRLWPGYWQQHLVKVVAEYALGFVVVGSAITAPVIITSQHAKPVASNHSPAKVIVQKPAAVAQPSTPAKSQPSSQAAPTQVAVSPAPTPAPTPIASTQPTPGSGAKGLAPATSTPSTTSSPTSTSSPSTPTGTSQPSQPTPTSPSGSSTPTAATGGYTSTNWSGYTALAGGYTAISASWTVPVASGNGTSASADAAWIGIGGVTSSDLIQTGTEDSVSASGQDQPGAFYEMLPAPALLITSLTISAGDNMSATITETTTNTWQITITDDTTNQTYTTTISYTSTNSSVEWIEEDPSYENGELVPLDNFGSVTFSSASATANHVVETIASAGSQPITLVNTSGQPLATPSVLIDSGAGFVVTQSASQ